MRLSMDQILTTHSSTIWTILLCSSSFVHFRYCICSSLYHLSNFFLSTLISASYQNIWSKWWFCSNLWSSSYSRWRKEKGYKDKWWRKNQGVWIFVEKGWNLIILVVFFIFSTVIQKQKAEKGKNEKTWHLKKIAVLVIDTCSCYLKFSMGK